MNAIGPLAKGLAFLMGKQPEEVQHPRGFLGLEWSEQAKAGQKIVRIQSVLEESPAARGGLEPGDLLVKINDHAIASLQAARTALAEIRPRDSVLLIVRRGVTGNGPELKLTITAGEGL